MAAMFRLRGFFDRGCSGRMSGVVVVVVETVVWALLHEIHSMMIQLFQLRVSNTAAVHMAHYPLS